MEGVLCCLQCPSHLCVLGKQKRNGWKRRWIDCLRLTISIVCWKAHLYFLSDYLYVCLTGSWYMDFHLKPPWDLKCCIRVKVNTELTDQFSWETVLIMDYLCSHSALPFSPLALFRVNVFKLYHSYVETPETKHLSFQYWPLKSTECMSSTSSTIVNRLTHRSQSFVPGW